jgi:hypothetical protein
MKRQLLQSTATRERVQRLFDEAGWQRVDDDFAPTDVVAYKASWNDPSQQAVASYIENRPLSCAYIFASDEAQAEVRRLIEGAGLFLPPQDALAAPVPEDDPTVALRTIGRIGLLAHGAIDKQVFAKLTALLLHAHEPWQRFALYALSNTSWSAFGPVLRQAIDAGAFQGELKAGAEAMLRDLEASNWNEALYRE